MYKLTIPTGSLKQSTSLLLNSSRLTNTINILSNGILIKTADLKSVSDILKKSGIKFTVKKVN